MIIKKNDRVVVYGPIADVENGFFSYKGVKGKVTSVEKNTIYVAFKLDDSRFDEYSYQVHPKQCRKLVKRGKKNNKS